MAQTTAEPRIETPHSDGPGRPLDILMIGLGRLTPVFRAGLRSEAGIIDDADDLDSAAALARSIEPDLILVGGRCGEDSSGLVAKLRTIVRPALILYLAPSSDPVPALGAVTSGADDVVIPPHTLASVMLRVRILQGRNGDRARTRTTAGPAPTIVVDRVARVVSGAGEPVGLTGREFELLDRLLEEEGQVVTRRRLLEDIWGEDQSSEAVLDATVHRLRRKVESNPARPRLLFTVRGIGYRLEVGSVRVTPA